MSTHVRKKFALAVLVGTSLVLLSGGLAANGATTRPEDIRSALQQVIPEVLSGLTGEHTTDDGDTAIATSVGNTSVNVPTDPSSGIDFIFPSGKSVSVGLPFPSEANDAFVVQRGIVAYGNSNGSTTVPAVKSDSSVQISTVIDSASAPTRYVYSFDLSEGADLILLETGGAMVTGDDGLPLLNIAPPMAWDSGGSVVPTRYEVSGPTLIQVVELSESATYPIVADPWLNVALIETATVTYPYGGTAKYKVNVTPSDWGKGWVGPLTWGAWESELKTKLGSDASKVTFVVREQLNCHLAGFPLSLPEFNLESWRQSMTWSDMAPYNCNYPEGGWGSAS